MTEPGLDAPLDSPEPAILPVLDIGTTLDENDQPWPTAVVDVTDHPEVADLARVHAVEGIGDIATEALVVPLDEGHLFLLGIRVTSPVSCAFALSFALPDQLRVLLEAAEAGHLLIATTDPEAAADEQPLWLAIDLDRDQLRLQLPD